MSTARVALALWTSLALASTATVPAQFGEPQVEEPAERAETVEPAIPAHPTLLQFATPRFAAPNPKTHRIDLPHGVPGFVVVDDTLPLVDVTVALRVGSFLDPEDQAGLALFTGALIGRAGAGELSADAFDRRVAGLGARIDSFTGLTRGGATLNVTTPNLEEALELFFSMLEAPRFEPSRLEATRRNLAENMRRRNADPLDILEREWEWLLWGREHFSTRPVTLAGIQAISRQDLADFHRRYWHPSNLVIAVSGAVSKERARTLLDEQLRNWVASSDAIVPAWPPEPPQPQDPRGAFVIDRETPQAKVRLGQVTRDAKPWTEKQEAVLLVMNEILGGEGAISRVAGRLRTAEGLVYRASASFSTSGPWQGELRVFFDTANRSVADAVDLARAEIRRLREEPVHPDALATVKESLLAGLRQSFDSAEEIAGYLAEDALLDRPAGFWQRRYAAIQEVTIAEVQAAARSYLRPEALAVLAVGRSAEISPPNRPTEGLAKVFGKPTVTLPLRDPLTLEPIREARP